MQTDPSLSSSQKPEVSHALERHVLCTGRPRDLEKLMNRLPSADSGRLGRPDVAPSSDAVLGENLVRHRISDLVRYASDAMRQATGKVYESFIYALEEATRLSPQTTKAHPQ
jgi:hypothetical protein